MTKDLETAKQTAAKFKTQAESVTAKADGYDALFEAQKLAAEEKYEEAANALTKVDTESLADGAKEIYNQINTKVNGTVIETLFKKGEENFKKGKYEEAKTDLAKVVELNPEHDYAQYYLARCYEQLNDPANAKVHYQKVVELLPETTQRAQTAKNYLAAHP